jgi:hypothetical protein
MESLKRIDEELRRAKNDPLKTLFFNSILSIAKTRMSATFFARKAGKSGRVRERADCFLTPFTAGKGNGGIMAADARFFQFFRSIGRFVSMITIFQNFSNGFIAWII